jgi:hypothetical protein
MNPRQRSIQLIALATNNPSSEEARTAAVQAAELIKKHNLLQVTEQEVRAIPQADGFLGFMSGFLSVLVDTGVVRDLQVAVSTMSAEEIVALKARLALLERENKRLAAENAHLKTPVRKRRKPRAVYR